MPTTPPPEIPEPIIDQAIAWLVRLQSGEAGDDLHAACRQWRASDPLHEAAWQELQADAALFHDLPRADAGLALRTLERLDRDLRDRRRTLKLLALGGLAAGLGGWGVAREPWRGLGADLLTDTGERRTFELADGSRLLLNTRSRVAVRFDQQQRLVILLAGELQIDTGQDPAGRPFRVQTRDAQLRALGTLFSVRLDNDHTRLRVDAGAVAIEHADTPTLRVEAGQNYRIDSGGAQAIEATTLDASAWVRGQLVARHTRLDALAEELTRYRRGWISCDPAVAGLEVSGVFLLADIDRALDSLTRSLPVRIERFTRYWVRIVPVG